MCGICGSPDKLKFKIMFLDNIKRGYFSHSFTVVDLNSHKIIYQRKSFDTNYPFDELPTGNNYYYLGHSQAPTGSLVRDFERIHPSVIQYNDKNTYLAHNGILTDDFLDKYKWDRWDTQMLHILFNSLFHDNDITHHMVNKIEGSFACWYINENKNIFLFRNPQSPLYISEDSFSSTKFSDSSLITSGIIYTIKDGKIIPTDTRFKYEDIYGLSNE